MAEDRKPLVQVVLGQCLVCGAKVESADKDGLEGLSCARGHDPSPYQPLDAYYDSVSTTLKEDDGEDG